MKWSWKAFSLHLIACFVLALALAYALSVVIDAERGPEGADSTLFSMVIGGLLAPSLLAALAGWKIWSLKPLLVAGAIVSTLYSTSPAFGLITILVVLIVYFTSRKLQMLMSYYLPSKTGGDE